MRFAVGKFVPVDSYVHRLDPRSKILATFILVTMVLLVQNIRGYLIPGFLFILISFLSKVNLILYLRSVKNMWVLITFAFIIQYISTNITMAVYITLRLVFVIIFASVLTYTTSPLLIAKGLSDIMKWFGIKERHREDFSMIMTISMRFIPILFDEADRIIKAQIARGARFDQPGIKHKIKALIVIVIPLLISAIRKAEELSIALQARKYGVGPRTSYYELQWNVKDTIFIIISISGLMFVIFWG
ncbi:energy-coupling factor transporter transmembrane protein EcfT [Thermosipho ferrireducens]|uniref:Energy-coupling factor transporter transmembrane protein EcfT n=1 Tax=Thermosipho ferrireducens TaxID=2571116 RepID=A0ABX7S6N8_9BACT|nr:energy-coupling factor transporter transmembrane component T [Thermosipho ferrireducens]QTA37430.1 energy-coupling factor transporter transmembrane protein EcfT [Thermosipho ferrireducens]